VETGFYPDTTRHFQVTRCNHCANPPCARICPVTAMYQRTDGIVEFDPDICVGCKACMQACPYDAIYIDPDSGTAAKCHYCGHRTEIGLEPACVVICPVHAIVAGDMSDPTTEISQVLANNQVTVRKPEQGTGPKLFYINGTDIAMHPTATARAPETFLWADVIPLHEESKQVDGHTGRQGNGHEITNHQLPTPNYSSSGKPIRTPRAQGTPWNGPIQTGGHVADHMVQVAYNAQHKIPWHWPVPAYLVTKGIGTGIFMVIGLFYGLGLIRFDRYDYMVSSFAALVMIGITTGLLVYDLEKPKRFLSIVFRPQWKSWLAKGALLLIGFSIVVGTLWLSLEISWIIEPFIEREHLLSLYDWVRIIGLFVGVPLAAGAAMYTAFLFGQAEGRDFWQSALLPFHMLIQALMAGSAALLFMSSIYGNLTNPFRLTLIAFLFLDLAVILFGEFGMSHASEVAAQAAHDISHGRYKNYFWWGSVVVGHLLPLGLL
ncbi:MAG: polysulfide reductase NrfD, partial [Chloroflexi bacterium]|nr:polysulfide reductase NrfD [Chloroflexota bacterium]